MTGQSLRGESLCGKEVGLGREFEQEKLLVLVLQKDFRVTPTELS